MTIRSANDQAPPRKRTYVLRKEERARLLQEAAALEQQLALLRGLVGRDVNDDEAANDAFVAVAPALGRGWHQAAATNVMLHDALRATQLVHANLKLLLAEANRPQWNALHTLVHLGVDWNQRVATLRALKQPKVAAAMQLVADRTKFHDLTCEYSARETFKNAAGDACLSFCDVTPLDNLQSVRQAYDALKFVTRNAEIVVSEAVGMITTREDIADLGEGDVHVRLVATLDSTVEQESNVVSLLHYNEQLDVAILVLETVDEDALFPYSPLSRVRRDSSAAVMVSRVATQGRFMLVMRRLHYAQIHRPSRGELLDGFQRICKVTPQWMDAMLLHLQSYRPC